MNIISKKPFDDGSFSVQTWNGEVPPNGYAVIADTVDMTDFYARNGFVTLTIEAIKHTRQVPQMVMVEKLREVDGEDGPVTETYYEDEIQTVDEVYTIDTVTAYTPNVEAWEAWKASLPEPAEAEPTAEERIAELEAANVALEDAMCEMDIANQTQIAELQATNVALEDALCEMDLANEERFVAIEDALCELDKG